MPKLNIGGRTTRIPGFLTVDLYEGDGVDVRTDASDLSMFKDGEVEEIYASHILEHFPHRRTVDVLKEWRRVLATGGRAHISVPDFNALVSMYQKFGGLNQFLVDLGWGGQEYPEAYHYAPFTYPLLAAHLVKAGFSNVRRVENLPYDVKDCSHNVDTLFNTPISVNVEAVA